MIQRVQSIWLLFAVITLIALFFLPLLVKDPEYSVYITGIRQHIKSADGDAYITQISKSTIALNGLSALLCLAGIFLFRNRSLQKNVIISGILLIMVLIALCGFGAQDLPGGLTGISVTIGTFLPLLAVIFCLLALRGIRHDEQLLRSADRLR